jgi:DnaK suppressor protein
VDPAAGFHRPGSLVAGRSTRRVLVGAFAGHIAYDGPDGQSTGHRRSRAGGSGHRPRVSKAPRRSATFRDPMSRASLTDDQLRAIREELLGERADLIGQVQELDAEADVNNWREGGFDDDPADAGSASFERETAQSLSNHARNLLLQIDDALRRMDAGTYGRCERCGRSIEAARLEALPYAQLCLDCKRRDETGR